MITGKVRIKITGRQTLGEESDTTVLEAQGSCSADGDGYRIEYIETPAEDMEVENVITFSVNKAVILKRGIVESEMIFVPGEKKWFAYKTPFGIIDMAVQCEMLQVLESDDKNEVRISYHLYSGEQLVAYCNTLIETVAIV